ncbi:MAG TPA: anthranilate synthase component I [Ktedonobacterales bacterium]|nr:anthranilate synthase component I [Ktedonobacterales bacterium]
MYQPTVEEARRLRAVAAGEPDAGNLLPVSCEVFADMETPVSVYLKVAGGPYTFLLESVEGGERIARYSFVGLDPYLVMTMRGRSATLTWRSGPKAGTSEEVPCDDPLRLIEAELSRSRLVKLPGMPRFHGGAVGYLGYETVACFERLPVPDADPLQLPESVFCFTETMLVFDHLRRSLRIISHVRLDDDLEANYQRAVDTIERLRQCLQNGSAPVAPQIGARGVPEEGLGGRRPLGATSVASGGSVPFLTSRERFEANVERAKEYIQAGDIFQVVLSQRFARPVQTQPFSIYRALRAVNPSPYLYYLDLGEITVVGASPELLVRVEDGEVIIRPLAGTRPRGKDEASDQALERELRADEKERAEHLMLVDLGRNDVGRVAEAGSVRVTEFMEVERYSHVMHLMSHVTGRLRADLTPYDALRAAFPAGTLSGAPKVRAMEIIAELEGERRGVYGGAVGYFSHSGNLDMAIGLRTLVLKDGVAYGQAGAGIVADSVPMTEYEETAHKAGALMRALERAEALERGDMHVAAAR